MLFGDGAAEIDRGEGGEDEGLKRGDEADLDVRFPVRMASGTYRLSTSVGDVDGTSYTRLTAPIGLPFYADGAGGWQAATGE